ncbi:MAG: hypothetical protein ACE14V_16420, partial [bacterium]
MNASTEVDTAAINQKNKVPSLSNTIDIPYLKEMSLTSPNFVFGLSLVFIAILWIILSITPFSNIQLMVQILAAYSNGMIVAFVLTFFMTLLAGILNSKYSPRLIDVVFSRWTIGYMFFFVISIVFTLLCIKGNVVEWDIRLGFCLLSTCFFLLIPYIIFIKEYLKPEQFIRNMSRLALSRIQHLGSDLESLPEEINQIDY